jgi:hypothetical protein
MQHHGAPTRLLDFTESPYIAAYFALERATGNAAVWAVHTMHLKEDLARKSPNSFKYHEDEFYDLPAEAFNNIFEENSLSCVFPVRPSMSSKRYMAQQALFVSLGNSNSTFMEQLLSYSWPEYLSDHVCKVVLPYDIRDEALFDLRRMNVNRATLFPDIDGFALHLRNSYELRYRGAASAVRYREFPVPVGSQLRARLVERRAKFPQGKLPVFLSLRFLSTEKPREYAQKVRDVLESADCVVVEGEVLPGGTRTSLGEVSAAMWAARAGIVLGVDPIGESEVAFSLNLAHEFGFMQGQGKPLLLLVEAQSRVEKELAAWSNLKGIIAPRFSKEYALSDSHPQSLKAVLERWLSEMKSGSA